MFHLKISFQLSFQSKFKWLASIIIRLKLTKIDKNWEKWQNTEKIKKTDKNRQKNWYKTDKKWQKTDTVVGFSIFLCRFLSVLKNRYFCYLFFVVNFYLIEIFFFRPWSCSRRIWNSQISRRPVTKRALHVMRLSLKRFFRFFRIFFNHPRLFLS